MKKVTQKAILIVFVTCMLAGCQPTNSSEGSLPEVSQTEESPFNTLDNVRGWGDEADFLRIADFDAGDRMDNAETFEGNNFTLTDERDYLFVIYSHNTSDEKQELALTLSYPETILAGEENQVNAFLSWGGEECGLINDTLTLDAEFDLQIRPLRDEEGCYTLRTDFDDGGNMTPIKAEGAVTMDGITTHVVSLGDIEPGHTYATFIFFEGVPRTPAK